MLLADAGLLHRVELVASDISARALERARSGRFGRRSLRDPPDPALAARWLKEDATGALVVAEELRNSIQWKRLNLCDPAAAAAMAPCDVVLCRNVLIYFSDETLVRVLRHLSDSLAPEGSLFVGIAESLLRFGTFFTCEEKNRVFFYRKGK